MKKTALALAICLSLCSIFSYGQSNLLHGDSDVEIEADNMTNGVYNSCPAAPKWRWDQTTGYDSKSSINLLEFCGVGVGEVKLPAGKYTFSFWAKGSVPSTCAYIMVNEVTSTWAAVLKKRAESPIDLTTEWQHYSVTFTADGKSLYSPYYGIEKEAAWFDRFMLNAGDKAPEWKPTGFILNIVPATSNGNVYPFDRPVQVDVQVVRYGKDETVPPLNVKVIDYMGEQVAEYNDVPKFDSKGTYALKFTIPGGKSGWYRIAATLQGFQTQYNAIVMTRPPEPTIKDVEPFIGLCVAQDYIEASKLIGVKWIQKILTWKQMEPQKGVYNIDPELCEYKKKGFKIQVCLNPSAPDWIQPKDVLTKISEYKMSSDRLLPPANTLDVEWRAFIRAFLEKYKDIVDIYELGGEIDALIGMNTYYKSLDTKNMIGPFVLGESLERFCKQMNIAAEEILRVSPEARISAVRPSDVDSRYAYAYSRSVFKNCGKNINIFGLDCYPQPRWIGPGQPPSGSERDLSTRYNDALAVMKQYGKTTDIFISEYGYFIDFNDINNPKYLLEQTNRLARSYLKAKVLGMKSLHWYAGGDSGFEGQRYYMGIWLKDGMPLPSVAALNAVGRIVENVSKCAELSFYENTGATVYCKVDGRAVGALWSGKADFNPIVSFDADKLEVTDVMGNPIKPVIENGKIQLRLNELPYYVWRVEKGDDNYAALRGVFNKIRIQEESPAEISFRPEDKSRLKIYMKNKSLKDPVTGIVEYNVEGKKGDSGKFSISPNTTGAVYLPLPASGKTMKITIKFDGDYRPHTAEYTTPEILKAARINGIKLDGTLNTWSAVKPLVIDGKNHIMPIDHTTWSGSDDLSAKLYLAHDGKFLYVALDATDDAHFNSFDNSHIWSGDCLQLGFDPLTNYIRDQNDTDPDDTFLSLALAKGHPDFDIHRGPLRDRRGEVEYNVVRDEKSKHTLYQLKIPLDALDAAMQPGKIFGFNCVIMDDDSGGGADYWLFLNQGLAGGLRPDKFAPCVLE